MGEKLVGKDQEAEVVGFFAWHSFWVMRGSPRLDDDL